MRKYFFIVAVLISFLSFAQTNKQNIRGVVIDKLSKSPLTGATVQVSVSGHNKGTVSDLSGNYLIPNLPPDRYEIKVSYIGYKNVVVSNVIVTSGKETILDISMEEDLLNYKEVVISVNDKDKTINDLATNSARTFSMEEVIRYLDTVKATIEAFNNGLSAELLFLDIHLADGNSFEIFSKSNINIPIIFTTAFDHYAFKHLNKIVSIIY